MGSEAEDSQGSGEGRAPRPCRPPPGRTGLDSKVLEEVLERALALSDPSESILPADLEALREVARRHRHAPFSLEPVAADLVEAILRKHFQDPDCPQGSWRSMSLEIAQTLFEDPVVSERLRGLWSRLDGKA